MIRNDIIRMAREQIVCNVIAAAGDCGDCDYKQFAFNVAIKVAELSAAAERKACEVAVSNVLYGQDGCGKAIEAIRTRGQA